MLQKFVYNSFKRLKDYCEKEDFKGWDPYDGLNSKFFNFLPFKKYRIAKILWIHLFKLSPVNLRRLFLVSKEYNPKGLSLFISAYCNLYKSFPCHEYKEKIFYLISVLFSLQSKGWSGASWGYNFDWQSRAFYVPRKTPNVIVSTFAANALLDVYDTVRDEELLKVSRSVCDFILCDLNRTYNGSNFCFSYTPLDRSRIYNASFLASRLLARIYAITGEKHLKEEAKKSITFCVREQKEDGSWFYGMDSNQQWIDSFHTAYNLESLYDYQMYAGDDEYEFSFREGIKYYFSHFFTRNSIPKYYDKSIWPIDIHSPASMVALLAKTGYFREKYNLINSVLEWVIMKMQDPQGFFYFQMRRRYTVKVAYMRWSQSWMFYALSWYMLMVNDGSNFI